ncbi:MAG: amidohydrolase [Candidatus Omnitrophota bacterium]|jgi:predicted TIM-barrel fold metal-dependent hydrolase|nr:MAG: amidohydrolase [Candidatus Omnitrophota bacterium]
MIIDVHAHIFPDSIALDVVPKMAEIAGIREVLDGRLLSLRESMKTAGIDAVWLQPVATKPQQVDKINRWMEEVRCEAVVAFGAVHPEYPDLGGLIRNLSSRGFPGVKIHPEYQTMTPLDSRWFPLYEAVIEEKMIILYHAGVDIGIPTINSTPQQFAELSERFPDLTLILAHMGGFQQWEEVAEHVCGLNVYLDTSYVFGHCSDEMFVSLARAHGVDKVVFGADSPWADQQADLEHLKHLPFSQDELDQICGLNAQRILDSHRKPTSPHYC